MNERNFSIDLSTLHKIKSFQVTCMVLAVVEIVEVTLMENLLLNITVKDFSIMLHIWFGLEGNQLRCIGEHLLIIVVVMLIVCARQGLHMSI